MTDYMPIHFAQFSAAVGQIPFAVYRRTVPFKYRIAVRLRIQKLKGYSALRDPRRPIPISPADIYYVSDTRFIPEERHLGKIKNGDWDRQRTPFESTSTYQGLYERFVEGYDWRETEYYTHAEDRIATEGEHFGYTDIDEFLESRCEYVDDLYDSIRKKGYQPNGGKVPYDPRRPWSRKDPTGVSVVVDRNGEFLLHDGHHRVALSRILNIDRIPVHVLVRHEKWQQYREVVFDKSRKEDQTVTHTHPDLHDLR
ncbi:hypothetical protein JCM18237_14840 [Halorubrum luteum]